MPDATLNASFQAHKRRYCFGGRTPLTPAITGLVPRKTKAVILMATRSKLW